MKIRKRWILAEDLGKTWNFPLGKRAKYFWDMGWRLVPETMFILPFGIFATLGLTWMAYDLAKNPIKKKYWDKIVIFRPDDPRVKDIPLRSHMDP